jgi:hypothetical protein
VHVVVRPGTAISKYKPRARTFEGRLGGIPWELPEAAQSDWTERQTARGLFCGGETQSRIGVVKFICVLSFAEHISTFFRSLTNTAKFKLLNSATK